MINLYLFCLIPAAVWLFCWLKWRNFEPIAIALPLLLCLLLAGAIHSCSFRSRTGDTEIWSGKVLSVKCFSAWTEKYQDAVYKDETYYVTVNGKRERRTRSVFSHYEWRTDYNPRYNKVYTEIGEWGIGNDTYEKFVKEFGGETKVEGDRSTYRRRSHMVSGDKYDYVSVNKNNPIIPVQKEVSFTNRLKVGSVWDKAPPPPSLKIHGRPTSPDLFVSNRLIGTAKQHFSIRKLDELNAVLGPKKEIDLNIVGYEENDPMFGQYTESAWSGGNKNSLTICYGGNKNGKPEWVYCFGWSDSDVCKKNIEQIVLTNGANDAILPLLKTEIEKNYQRADWHKFDYIQIQPTNGDWIWLVVLTVLINLGVVYAMNAEKVNNFFKSFFKTKNPNTENTHGHHQETIPPSPQHETWLDNYRSHRSPVRRENRDFPTSQGRRKRSKRKTRSTP